jgi:hypothetical protein
MAGNPIDCTGIDVLELQATTKLIKKAYSEWNNGELLYDLARGFVSRRGMLVPVLRANGAKNHGKAIHVNNMRGVSASI